MIELVQTAIAAERHDRVQFPFHHQNVALVFGGDLPPNRGQRRERIEFPLDGPLFRTSEDTQFLE